MLASRRGSRSSRRLAIGAVLTVVCAVGLLTAPASSAATGVPYRQDDYAQGQTLSVLPPGEHGLYNAADIALLEPEPGPAAAAT